LEATAAKHFGLLNWLIYRKSGDFQTKIISHVDRGGTIICEADSYQEAYKRVEDAVKQIVFCL
jgi:hypothetical protein